MAKNKNPFETTNLKRLTEKAFRDVAEKEVRTLRRGTASWDTRVSFKIEPISSTAIGFKISTDSQVWKWVNYGTKPHVIEANGNSGGNGRNLAFQSQFKPKTLPNRITSRSGGKSGQWVYPQKVYHTGAEPRDFLKNLEPQRDKRIEESLDKYLKTLFS